MQRPQLSRVVRAAQGTGLRDRGHADEGPSEVQGGSSRQEQLQNILLAVLDCVRGAAADLQAHPVVLQAGQPGVSVQSRLEYAGADIDSIAPVAAELLHAARWAVAQHAACQRRAAQDTAVQLSAHPAGKGAAGA